MKNVGQSKAMQPDLSVWTPPTWKLKSYPGILWWGESFRLKPGAQVHLLGLLGVGKEGLPSSATIVFDCKIKETEQIN